LGPHPGKHRHNRLFYESDEDKSREKEVSDPGKDRAAHLPQGGALVLFILSFRSWIVDKNIQTCLLRFFIVSLGALINHNKFQHDSSTPSWSKCEIEFTIWITMANAPKNFLIVLVQMWAHFSIVIWQKFLF
jgi:hypothetical protein